MLKKLIDNKDLVGIMDALSSNPLLANEGIPYDDMNTTQAHPLHRICDGVFENKYTDEEAVEIAKIFLEYGAYINGDISDTRADSPLIAAASLHADQVGLLYIHYGADIHRRGCHGGTALHWAAWCGREVLVKKLILEKAEINLRCTAFRATPLFWAMHGLKNGGEKNFHHQVACIRLLLDAGADTTIPNGEGNTVMDLLEPGDDELRKIFKIIK